MPDLTGMPALDVALALSFVFFMLSLVCTSIQEVLAAAFNWRAKNLEDAIRNLLDDPKGEGGSNLTKEVYGNPRIQALIKKPNSTDPLKPRGPSYIPARTFARALFDTLAPKSAASKDDPVAEAKDEVDKISSPWVRDELNLLLAGLKEDRDEGRLKIETWFDDTMERATGWYKRKTQICLAVIAVAVAGGLNADALQIGEKVWRDDAVRAALVAKAEAAVQAPASTDDAGTTTPQPTTEQLKKELDDVSGAVKDAQGLEIPLGWSAENTPDVNFWEILAKAFGVLITAAALMLGAPFWFDTLSKLAKLRSTGHRETTGTTAAPMLPEVTVKAGDAEATLQAGAVSTERPQA